MQTAIQSGRRLVQDSAVSGLYDGPDEAKVRECEDFMVDKFKETETEGKRQMYQATFEDQVEAMRATGMSRAAWGWWGASTAIDPSKFSLGAGDSVAVPPANVARVDTIHARCSCDMGLDNVTMWPDDDTHASITVHKGEVRWIKWGRSVAKVRYACSGMGFYEESELRLGADQWLSIGLEQGKIYSPIRRCHRHMSGYLRLNKWSPTDYVSSIPFTTGTEGYACFKIPALLRTQQGTLIAFAEARRPTCSDFAPTDVVYKRSTDGGRTWGALKTLVDVPEADKMSKGLCGNALVVGNVAPVQLRPDAPRHPGRILVPYTRNNFKAWIIHSDNDGVTWEGDRELENMTVTEPGVPYADAQPDCDRGMGYFGLSIDSMSKLNPFHVVQWVRHLCYEFQDPYHNPMFAPKLSGAWQWVGIGPPGSLELSDGRIVVPSYHSFIRGLEGDGVLPVSQLYNNFALGHTMISDDGGDTWRLGKEWELGNGANENQLVEFPNRDILANSRSLSTGSPQYRLQARSTDRGESFSESEFVDIPEPFNGCQGSTILGSDGAVYVSSPDPTPATSWAQAVADMLGCKGSLTGRDRVTIWRSTDEGRTYPVKKLVDPGLSAQTSMQQHNGQILLLYEQADPDPLFTIADKLLHKAIENLHIELPNRFVYREVAAGDAFSA